MTKHENHNNNYESFDEDKMSAEESKELDALNHLAKICQGYVHESITARNTTNFSEEIKRSFLTYNASDLDGEDKAVDNFEGTRTSTEEGSKVTINIIRQITNDGASQIGDMLFPSDEKNYGINPVYPAKPPLAIRNEPAIDQDGNPLAADEETGEPVTNMQAWDARKIALVNRVERMGVKIDATMERIQFGKIGRRCIEDAAQTGTGIIKGPFLDPHADTVWKPKKGKWTLEDEKVNMATYSNVSVLDFLPDMSAEVVKDAAYINVRSWKLPRQVESLKGINYKDDQIDRLLIQSPKEITSYDHDNERNYIKDQAIQSDMYSKRYEIFETWTDFSREELEDAGVKIPARHKERKRLMVCVIHSAGITIKCYVAPQQNVLPFSVWCWDESPLSIFGKGIPTLGYTLQLVFNASYRMIMDHAGVSAVPQIVMQKDKLTPSNGDSDDYTIRGGRIWEYVANQFNLPDGSNLKPFEIFEIPMQLDQLFAILVRAEEDLYKVTGVTKVEKNVAGVDNAPVTLGATQIYQSNASSPRKRQVKSFDDQIIKTIMTRQYGWEMEFGDDDGSKGKMVIEPKGSSVLMEREMNVQRLMMLLQTTGNGAMPGAKTEDILRRIESGMQLPSGSVIETKEETADRQKLEAENPAVDPLVQIENVKLDIEKARLDGKQQEVEAKLEIEQARLNMDAQDKQANLELKAIAGERLHVREMLRLELMDRATAQASFDSLQKRQSDISIKMEKIQTDRDIAVGKMLGDQEVKDAQAESTRLSALSRSKEADTKERELNNKISGTIEQGI